jgi:hypothetical protein
LQVELVDPRQLSLHVGVAGVGDGEQSQCALLLRVEGLDRRLDAFDLFIQCGRSALPGAELVEDRFGILDDLADLIPGLRLELLDFKFQEQFPGELDASKMLWFSVAPPVARVHAGPGLLEDFLKLDSASDEAILVCARRWGPLWLCPVHNLPWQHDPGCEPSVSGWEPEVDQDDEDDEDDETLT